jgi:hypothetical protein
MFCKNCGDVMDFCYRFETSSTGGLARFKNHNWQFIQYLISAESIHASFLDRKTAFNSMRLAENVSMASLREKSVTSLMARTWEEILNPFEWWPLKTYVARYGEPGDNGLGHVQRKLHNLDGVAIYMRPEGVRFVYPKRSSGAHQDC